MAKGRDSGLFHRGDSKVWWLSYQANGKRYRQSSGTTNKDAARALLGKIRADVFKGVHFPDSKKGRITVGKLRDLWLEHIQTRAKPKKSAAADVQRFEVLVELLGAQTPIATLTGDQLREMVAELGHRPTRRGPPMSAASVNRHVALLSAALAFARRSGYRGPELGLQWAELKRAEHNHRDRVASDEEVERILAAAPPEVRLAVLIAFHTGMRAGEVVGLRWPQIDERRRIIQLEAANTKTGKARRIPMADPVIEALKAWPRRIGERTRKLRPGIVGGANEGRAATLNRTKVIPPDRVFTIDRSTLSSAFSRICAELEPPILGLRLHDLRHTRLTRLKDAGVDVMTIAAISGHTELSTLRRYMTHTDANLLEAIRKSERA